MAAITNSGEDVVSRGLDAESRVTPSHQLEGQYELARCVAWITKGGYQKVGLQFPDDLIGDAPGVARALGAALGFKVYILADTTYGSCCVDEVAAEHVGADSVIHFGRSCLSPSRRLPLLRVFTRTPVDAVAVVEGVAAALQDTQTPVMLLYDTRCHHAADEVTVKLKKIYPNLVGSRLLEVDEALSSKIDDDSNKVVFNGRCVTLLEGTDIKNYDIVYLGPNGPTVTCLSMKFSEKTIHCVNPGDGSITLASGVKSVMARSGKMEMAKDAEIIGILVGTLGVADYRQVITRLKAVIKAAGKRSYTFVVGKPNEPKLANISEVDVFVYVACPETSIVERSVDPVLYRKLMTPWELEVALLQDQEWSLQFEPDFRQLLPGGARHVGVENGVAEEQVGVSLITNKTQRVGIRDDEPELDGVSGAVVLSDGLVLAPLHVGGGGQVLKGRTWQGLDPSAPAPAVGVVVQGRRGIAAGYEEEAQ